MRVVEPPAAPWVLLDDGLSSAADSRLFTDPEVVIRCNDPADLEGALARLEGALASGWHAAGYFSYELGYLLEPKLRPLLPENRDVPLFWVGLFPAPQRLSMAQTTRWIEDQKGPGYHLHDLLPNIRPARYREAFEQVKDYISAGDVYQINLTFKYRFNLDGDPLALFADLRQKQRVHYGAFIETGTDRILSLSPELFLARQDGEIQARPMKGTAPRGRTLAEDREVVDWLHKDEKSRAENLMIVDLLRNDLGRAAKIGSVKVTDLYRVETYPTVHQMTSGITARLREDVGLRDLLCSLFPCGSVTGAPKVRAMEIIHELESEPRGVYTGAIGHIAPDGDFSFNVAIRSLKIARDGRGEMGIGSGVVFDSQAKAEYDECLLKGRFLTDPAHSLQLIETLRWQDDYHLLDYHMERLAESAAYFQFPFDQAAARAALAATAEGFAKGAGQRVRLLLYADGRIDVTSQALPYPEPERMSFVLSDRPVDSQDRYFYHKTTRRALYDGEWEHHHHHSGSDEVVFFNERGELTEGSRTNIFLEIRGQLVTPPISSGLLPGTFRRHMLENGAQERVLYLKDLLAAERVFLGNSVRGLKPGDLLPSSSQGPRVQAKL